MDNQDLFCTFFGKAISMIHLYNIIANNTTLFTFGKDDLPVGRIEAFVSYSYVTVQLTAESQF